MQKVQYLRALVVAGVLICPAASAACGGTGGAINNTIDDSTVTTRVKTALLNEPGVNAVGINVDTAGGVVTLSGQVKSSDEAQKAVATARRVSGVRDVKSELKVGGGGTRN